MQTGDSKGLEQRLLREIGNLADRVRELRSGPAPHDHTAIKALEEQSRSKWQQLRSARGGTISQEPDTRRSRLYR
jgi:hypothetical protein